MNQGIYKLVYSKVLHMFVPASEAVRGHGRKGGKRIRKHAKNLLCLVLMGSFVFTGNTFADPAGLIPGTQAWVNASITGATSNSMTITQTAPKAILDWQKLNLNAGELLQFNQQGQRTWSALNRIHDLNPSILNGSVLADGNVYFINTNGIIFGPNAQFNVGSLYAGTLDITDKLFNDGFINGDGITSTKVFEGTGGSVIVQKGALINAATGGKVMLFAPTVENSGIINTPDGQTILAAGKTVYLASSKDPAGFLVEVDGGTSATNLGKIVAERGNITMMGLAVNQQGTLTATTSVRANGSIRLVAEDGIDARNGIVTLAKGSVTEVNPEYANKEETIASQPFKTSDISIEASAVDIEGAISAKGGNVKVAASDKIFLGNNASIDVSGVDAVAPMSRNQLEIQLFSDQLKDAPILRDGGLFKQTVYVDARKGTKLFDIQPFLDLKGATVAEKMTKAGTVSLTAPNDVIAQKGSVINVSGGSTTFEAGTIKETNLYYNGKLVPISEAKPGIPYDTTADFYTVKDSKWGVTRGWDLSGGTTQGWGDAVTLGPNGQLKTATIGTQVASYFEGDDAGSLTIANPQDGAYIKNLALAGTLLANTKVSTQQLTNQAIPLGGKLVANANDLVIAKIANDITTGFTASLPNDFQSSASTDFLAQGFNRVDLSNVKNLAVNDVMIFKPNGELSIGGIGGTSNINANIIAPGANISLASDVTNVKDNVKISTAGTFTNDKTGVAGQFSNPAAVNGGSITATTLNFGKNVTLDASAGAWVDNKGKLNQGKAGDITFASGSKIDEGVTLQAYGFTKGGKLTLDLSGMTLNIAGNPSASLTDVDISKDFFNKGGFSSYSLTGLDVNIGDATAAPQEIYASAQTWQMNAGFANQTGGQAMSSVATPVVQADVTRSPVSLTLNASKFGGVLTLAENTTIRTDRQGSVSLSAGRQVNVLGDIVTPSGNIKIEISDKDVSGTLPYDATQAIYIGEKSVLSATGSSITLADSQPNLLKTQVFNAGNITIDAPKGALIVKDGAVLDVSGTSVVNDTKTLSGFKREILNGDAGTIKLSASDGLLLDGNFKGFATGTARAGTLDVGFTNAELTPLLTGNREFTLTQQKQLRAQNFGLGDSIKTASGDVFTATSTDALQGQISAEQVQQGGFANMKVKSFIGKISGPSDSIQLADGLDLKLAGNLQLQTSIINVKNDGIAKLNANGAIVFKSPNASVDNAIIATDKTGTLETHSKQVYIEGATAVTGTNKTAINTTLDITGANASIVANGDINLSARQIYPSSNVGLAFEAIGTDSKITVKSSGVAAKSVYSAGGVLKLTAEHVEQGGVISAPFGQIDIKAAKSATFSAGSTTSVSANGLVIPNGTTINGGANWVIGSSVPFFDKNISINSAQVDLQKGAVVDLSAGGDVFASEWVPGIGGTADVLSVNQAKSEYTTYAIIPSLGQDYAPIDSGVQQVGVGQSVYLTGVPGLESGYYTLLPASYALVPGAFMVETNVAGSNLLPTQVAPQLDGSTLTTGYRADIATGARDANWSTFRVTDGAIFRPAAGTTSKAPSQYILTSATKYFSNPEKTNGQDISLPIDVARLSLEASKLSLDSTIVANKQAGGSGLQVDLSASNIRVVNSVGADDGSLQLTAASLNALNADSLLLGGKRKLQDGIAKITTSANSVVIENNSANAVKTPEFIASATDNVTVKTGAVVDTGAASKTPSKSIIQADGNGALFAVSSVNDISYSRTGGSPTSATGVLNIEAGSTLNAGNSVVLDATNLASLNGNVTLQDGGSATFGANRILLGAAPLDVLGLNMSAAALAALGQIKSLTLNSYNNIDTFGSVNFGNNNLDLTMNAAGIVGHLASGEVSAPTSAAPVIITANTFTLKNTQGAKFAPPVDASGRGLEINASTVKFDDSANAIDATQVAGYSNLKLNANEVKVANQGAVNFNVADATFTTGRFTADTAANYKITANNLTITKLAGATLPTDKGFGASLDLSANNLTIASNIDLSSGKLALKATNDLNLANGAVVSASSTPITFYNKTTNASAGSITLSSTTGNVNVDTGAVVDVTSQGEANAGMVKVVATNGTANISGDLKGAATGTGKGGALDVDVKTLADLTTTNSKAAGFSEGRQYRVRTGDVNITGTVANNNALAARETIVSADAGKITVTGDIIATAPKNSRIGLYASNGVTLESTAKLEAKSTKAGEEGGKVEVYTTTGNLDLKTGTSIDVSAGAGGTGGKVGFRAPRTGAGAGDGVAVTNLAANIVGAKSTVLEAFKVFTGATSINTGSGTGAALGFTTIANDVNSFMGNKDAIVASLDKTSDTTFHLRAGTEIQSAASLTIGSDWNLYSASRTGGEPSVLTLRAKDNIIFNGSLSDGFDGFTPTTSGVIGEGDSTSYRIVAGADLTAANLLATNASTTSGNITLNNGTTTNTRVIRTGTGDIDIAAGGNLVMGGVNTAIYTAGRSAAALDGFDLPANNLRPLYLTDGGDISIAVKGNIAGGEPATGRQLINQWLFRQGGGTGNLDTTWWVRPDLFKQSLATFGGGDININAGGNISNFSASAPTTARFDTNGTSGNQSVDGGGDVIVKAASDINNGVYFVAKGDGDIEAGGSIQKQGNTFGTTLALQDGSFNVSAGKNAYIETTINPTLVGQPTTFTSIIDATGKSAYFNSYSPLASVSVSSLTGKAEFGTGTVSGISNNVAGLATVTDGYKYNPSTLNVVANNGDAVVGDVTLLPSATGNLKVLAANNVNLGNVTMSDADPAALPTINKPVRGNQLASVTNQLQNGHSSQLLHKNDAEPVLIVAQKGDIKAVAVNNLVTLPKAAQFIAGKDIDSLKLVGQNNNASDITLLKAGQDIKVGDVTIAGPGELLVQAGRNIDFTAPQTLADITTVGNVNNTALPADGASITLQAGLGKGANIQGYIDQYILPTGAGPTTIVGDAAKLAEYRAATAAAVTEYMRKTTGSNALTDAQALAQFNALSVEAKTIFANRHLTSELIASAKDFAKAGNHNRGNSAIATLFPTLNQGDILLYASKVATNSGGSIDLIAPGGLINVGSPGKRYKGDTPTSGDIGVITEKGGAIRAIADGDFQVNQSKVITQFGSDIAIWSTKGTIDAGRGSKTATSIPERIVQTDAAGNTTVEVRGVASGSGIRAQTYDEDGPNGPKKAPPKGNIYLTAPIVDAGEAGIEAGDLFIVAPIVLNATNIQVSGTSSGVPVAATSSLAGVSAGLSPDAVNSATAAVAQSVAQSASQSLVKPELPSIISVDVISIGK